MNPKPFGFHPEARKELREAVRWYRERNPAVGAEFRLAVSLAVGEIADTPKRWSTYLFKTRRYILDRFPFSIVYLVTSEGVSIVAVAHSKRKPGYWRRRL